MTIPEAAQLVIQASALSTGCNMFILNMGKMIKIKDLIYKLVKLSGLTVKDNNNPDGDIEISLVGLRPGEKLYEELLIGEKPESTLHPKIDKVNDPSIDWDYLKTELKSIEKIIKNNNIEALIPILKKIVSGFNPNKETIRLMK